MTYILFVLGDYWKNFCTSLLYYIDSASAVPSLSKKLQIPKPGSAGPQAVRSVGGGHWRYRWHRKGLCDGTGPARIKRAAHCQAIRLDRHTLNG